MSDKSPEENNELAQVLNRINNLMKHGEVQAENPIHAENIPQLTEVYEGEPPIFISRSAAEYPTLNEVVSNSVTDTKFIPEGVSDQSSVQVEKMEALLAEMAPVVQITVEKAALRKLINTELRQQIEAQIMQSLREHLQSSVVNGKP